MKLSAFRYERFSVDRRQVNRRVGIAMEESSNKSWWSKRTSLEKSLTVICVITVLTAIGLLVGLIVVAVNQTNELDGICMTKACIAESSAIQEKMNLTADPCDNFFEFACGSFLAETVIPDDKSSVTSFSVITNKMKEELRVIVTEPIVDSEIQAFKDVKNLYKACMDTTTIETLGVTPVLDALNRLGGWPVVSSTWNTNTWTWDGSAALARENGYSVSNFLSFSVSTDNKNSTRRIIRIDQASLGLSKQYLDKGIEEPFVEAYHEYQVNLAVLFGASVATATAEMGEVLDFEMQLANISMTAEERRDANLLYNLRTSTQLNTDYPYVNWLTYFNSLLPEESQLVATDEVIVGALSFFEKLGDLLDVTPNRVKANYALWRAAVSSVSYMPRAYKELQETYSKATTGRPDVDPLWLQCVDTTLGFYPHAFGALYVRKHFNADAKTTALEMVNNIKDEFSNHILADIDWMDNDTKAKAKEKAEKMKEQIGFADELLDDAKITEFHNEWPAVVDAASYYTSVFNLNIASTLRSNKRLRQPIDKDEWTAHTTPAIVNAFYSSTENGIKFPAGILQGAFFNPDRPQYMNYGGIGFVIGHEITHGFDDQGSLYDGDGNLQNWWQEETRDKYLERAQCIINQYGNYTEPLSGLNLNGVTTQGENIADNGGIKQSYKAYVRWADKNPEKTMPGLDYSPQQMFWVSAGQIWCSIYREETIRNQVLTGVHSPGQFRVVGPMSNSEEFASDFNCPATSKMNPASKCEVW